MDFRSCRQSFSTWDLPGGDPCFRRTGKGRSMAFLTVSRQQKGGYLMEVDLTPSRKAYDNTSSERCICLIPGKSTCGFTSLRVRWLR